SHSTDILFFLLQACNLDGEGNRKHHGQLEITDAALIFHHKGQRVPWPLKYDACVTVINRVLMLLLSCPASTGIYANTAVITTSSASSAVAVVRQEMVTWRAGVFYLPILTILTVP